MTYVPDDDRYSSMKYRRTGRIGKMMQAVKQAIADGHPTPGEGA